MRSRLLIAATGWLLGAVTATVGSLFAVDQLGQGLLAQHTKRVSVAMVNRELAQENSERPGAAATIRGQSPSPSPSASGSHGVRASRTVHGTRRHDPPGPGRVLNTAGGQAEARCEAGGAYLVFASPGQGYDLNDLHRGPAQVASVTFTNSSGGVVLRVTCTSSGTPVGRTSTFSWGSGSHHDE